MRKLIVAAVVGMTGLVGCKSNSRTEVQEERKDVVEAQQEAAARTAEVQKNINEEKAQVEQEGRQEIAEAQNEVAEERKDLAETQREAAEEQREDAFGGSGTANTAQTSATGKLKSTLGKNLTLALDNGSELKLKTDDATQVMHNGKTVKLDELKEGTSVRAAYVTQGEDKVAKTVEVLQPIVK